MSITARSFTDGASTWLTSRMASLLPATTASASYGSFTSCQSGHCTDSLYSCTKTLYSCKLYSGGGGGEECIKINCCGTCYA